MPERFLTVTEAKKSFCELVQGTDETSDPIIITRDGHPKAVLLSYDCYEGMEETIEILSDPQLVKEIEEGIEDIRAGRTITLEELDKKLARKTPTRTKQSRRAKPGKASQRRVLASSR